MPGWAVIIIGIVLGVATMAFPACFFPAMFVYGIMTSMEWGKAIFEAVGLHNTEFYLWLAIAMILALVLGEAGGGVSSGIVIIALFVIFGLLQYPGPAEFIVTTVVPLSESWTVRIAGLVALGALPFLLLLFGITGII